MANEMMSKWYEAAKRRVSVREFDGKVPKELFYELKDFAQELANDEARIEFRSKNGILCKTPVISLLGGVEGTSCFASVIVRDGNKYMGGYIGEAFALECVSKGLGTCWLGATYKKKTLKDYVDIAEDEKLIGVIAVGRCSELPEPAVKKTIEQLTGLTRNEFAALPAWQQDAVQMARLSPSARNRQPWELELYPDRIRIVNTSSNFGFGDVDCGIAMLHIELGAAKHGIYGDWYFENGNGEATFVPVKNDRQG